MISPQTANGFQRGSTGLGRKISLSAQAFFLLEPASIHVRFCPLGPGSDLPMGRGLTYLNLRFLLLFINQSGQGLKFLDAYR